MTMRIHHYRVPLDGTEVTHRLRGPALSMQADRDPNFAVVWAEYHTNYQEFERVFRAFGTGVAIPSGFSYVATSAPHPEDESVRHVFVRSMKP